MSLNVEVEEVVDLAGSSGSPEQVIRRTMANSGQTTLLILAQKRGQMKATQHQQQHPLLPMIKTQRPKLSSIPKAARQRPIASAETTTQDIHNKVISSARRFGSAGVILVPKSARTQDGGEVHPVSGRLTGQALVPHPPVKAVPGPMIPAPPAAANPRRTTQHAMLPGVYVVRSQERPKPAAVETKLATPVISKALVPQSAGASGTRPNSPTHGTPRRQPLLRKPLIKLPATEDSCVQLIKKNKSKKLEPVSSEVIRNRVPAIMPAPGYVSPEGRRNSTLAQYPLMRRISGEPLKAAILPSRNETITSAGPKHLSPITKDSGDMPLVERIKSSKKKCARAIEPPPQPVYQQEFVTERVEVMPDLTSRPRPAAAGVRVRPSSRPPGPQPYRSSSPHLQRPSTTEHTGMERQSLPGPSSAGNSRRDAGPGASSSELRLGQPWGAWQPALSVANGARQKQPAVEAAPPPPSSPSNRSTEDSGYENDQDIESIDCKVPEPEPESVPIAAPLRAPAAQYTRATLEKQLRVLNWLTECTEDANPLYFPPAEPKPLDSTRKTHSAMKQNVKTELQLTSPLDNYPPVPTAAELEFV